MSLLSACQEAAIELNQATPTSIFSTDKFAQELRVQANRTAVAIAKAYDWQKLQVLKTYSGDGAATSFSLPSDYDRMVKKGELHSTLYLRSIFHKARDNDEWLYLQDNLATATPGYWIILGGQMQILPAMPVGETARFYYVRNTIIAGGTKTAFTDDNDTFDLPERLLTLGIVWRWRAMKRMEYAEDLRNFEIALAEEVATDKGMRILVVGQQRVPWDAEIAFGGIGTGGGVTPPPVGTDTTPDQFIFVDLTDVALSTQYISNEITVTGIDTASPLTITGGEYSLNDAAFSTAPTTVVVGDTVSVRVTSSALNSTGAGVTLTIGGVSDTFTVTTLPVVLPAGGGIYGADFFKSRFFAARFWRSGPAVTPPPSSGSTYPFLGF